MGRLLKNPDLVAGSSGARLPIGSNSLSDYPVNGVIRYNTDNNKIEFYYNNQWNQVAKIGTVQVVVDTFTGDGSTTSFTMSQSESDPTNIIVQIGGVYQQPTTNYTVSGTTITFTSAPPAPGVNPNMIVVVHNLNSTNAA
jgi:hypothetical protein